MALPSVPAPTSTTSGDAAAGDRRASGRRNRRTDRIYDRGSLPQAAPAGLERARQVENLLLFIDDDMRETALAIRRIERFLLSTLDLLEAPEVTRGDAHKLATDTSVLDHVDALGETVESLRRRIAKLSSALK
jgi:hypothetical protein